MENPSVESPKDLTAEQEKVLAEVYMYSDKAEYTEEDLALAREMFDKPEKFALLRKILQVFTPNERGLTIASAQAFVEASPADLQKYAFETAVAVKADEKVRQALVSFYVKMRRQVQEDMKKEFEDQNQKDFDEKQRTEQYEEQQAEANRNLGTQL